MKAVHLVWLWIVVSCLGGYGWINNIVLLFHMSVDPVTAKLILRIIGIFVPPIGAVLGFID